VSSDLTNHSYNVPQLPRVSCDPIRPKCAFIGRFFVQPSQYCTCSFTVTCSSRVCCQLHCIIGAFASVSNDKFGLSESNLEVRRCIKRTNTNWDQYTETNRKNVTALSSIFYEPYMTWSHTAHYPTEGSKRRGLEWREGTEIHSQDEQRRYPVTEFSITTHQRWQKQFCMSQCSDF